MKKIFKYPLIFTDAQEITIPSNSEFLSVVEQEGRIVCYFIIDTSEKIFGDVTFYIVGTGQEINSDVLNEKETVFEKTLVMPDGFVWHIFSNILRR